MSMRFWDGSALVPLMVVEPATRSLLEIYRQEDAVLAWWGTEIECTAALARFERDGLLEGERARDAFRRLDALAASWHLIQPSQQVKDISRRMLRVHKLRSSEALRLAAAFVASEGKPPSLEIVTLDGRIKVAAEREGFRLVKL